MINLESNLSLCEKKKEKSYILLFSRATIFFFLFLFLSASLSVSPKQRRINVVLTIDRKYKVRTRHETFHGRNHRRILAGHSRRVLQHDAAGIRD